MDLSLEQRLLRFLDREDDGERRSFADLRALPVEQRVLDGECIQDARLAAIDAAGASFVFEAGENLSKFRAGDALVVGDGIDFDAGVQLVYGGYDAASGTLTLQRDRFAPRGQEDALRAGVSYCVDRRPLGVRGRLQDVVRAGFAEPLVRDALEGRLEPAFDEARRERARARLRERGLNEAQVDAGAAAIAAERLCLVQGPPGTGKTRLLAELLHALCTAGCRIALCAFTHRAVQQALLTLRRLAPDLPLVKLVHPRQLEPELLAARVRGVVPGRGALPKSGAVIAGTSFALARLPTHEKFHFAVFDEAGQLPIPHAIAGMLLAQRWLFFGDHRQLPPVITAEHRDREVAASVFERLHALYGSALLDVTYRMNAPICAAVSELFYGGALRAAPQAAERRMPFVPGGQLDEVLDPQRPIVLARVDHLQPGMRSVEEANLVADLVDEIVRRHGVAAADVAVVAPFRAQARAVRSAIQRRGLPAHEDLTIDTVERIQGQEREVVIVSLAVGDPDTLDVRASFFFSTNRLNVALSRARCKAIVVASIGAFRALPLDADSLRAASAFKRMLGLLPQVDLSAVYC